MELKYETSKSDVGRNIKDILAKKLYISTNLINKLKITEAIIVNDKPVFTNYIMREHDVITVNLNKLNETGVKFKDKFKMVEENLDIIYEDEYLLIVNKPPFIPVHPSSNNYDETLSNIVAAYLYKQGIYSINILTRLDKNTSGICIFAKNEYIQELFTRKKEIINLKKEYLAIADGIIEEYHFIIEKNITRKNDSIILREVNENGDYAKTECNVISKNYDKNYTVLNIILHTGRTHQIRVHLANTGHVLLGDDLYAIEYNVDNICKYISRQALHCSKVSFIHPITNEKIKIESKIPKDIQSLI
jgi:23S rRNA pseudouridine1911/1915/1917 synthase